MTEEKAKNESANGEMKHSSKDGPSLDDLAASQIGQKLRLTFDEMLNEDVPDRFHDLLNRLAETEGGAGGGTSA